MTEVCVNVSLTVPEGSCMQWNWKKDLEFLTVVVWPISHVGWKSLGFLVNITLLNWTVGVNISSLCVIFCCSSCLELWYMMAVHLVFDETPVRCSRWLFYCTYIWQDMVVGMVEKLTGVANVWLSQQQLAEAPRNPLREQMWSRYWSSSWPCCIYILIWLNLLVVKKKLKKISQVYKLHAKYWETEIFQRV